MRGLREGSERKNQAERREGEDKLREKKKREEVSLALRRGLWRTLCQPVHTLIHKEKLQIYVRMHLHAHASNTQTLISKLISIYLIPQLSSEQSDSPVISSCQPLSVSSSSHVSLLWGS